MPWRTRGECVLWLNIFSHPATRGVLAETSLTSPTSEGECTCLKRAFLLRMLLWQSFNTHTYIPSWKSNCLSQIASTRKRFPLRVPITAISRCWLVTPYLRLNKRTEVFFSSSCLHDHLHCSVSGGMSRSLGVCYSFISFSLLDNITSSVVFELHQA